MTVGQNIAAGESNFSEAVKSWGQEVSSWSYGAVYNDSFANYFQVSVGRTWHTERLTAITAVLSPQAYAPNRRN